MATTGPRLILSGTNHANNSDILITSIGTDFNSPSEALVCNTDYRPCCRHFPVDVNGNRLPSISQGEWYYPNGDQVRLFRDGDVFYRTRGENDGTLNLFRRGTDITSPIGSFCCEIPVANGVNQTLCANIGEA